MIRIIIHMTVSYVQFMMMIMGIMLMCRMLSYDVQFMCMLCIKKRARHFLKHHLLGLEDDTTHMEFHCKHTTQFVRRMGGGMKTKNSPFRHFNLHPMRKEEKDGHLSTMC